MKRRRKGGTPPVHRRKLVIRHPFPVPHRQRPRSFRGYPVKGIRVTKAAYAPRVFPRQTSHR
ncbi:MAG TPA: hypothetical protein PLV10_02405, partial [Candidatus Latescibacteria bacterium]|nr:hypothetical protein [Candidatus Latescibacterota bacterium]